jgi:hypothetical protein
MAPPMQRSILQKAKLITTGTLNFTPYQCNKNHLINGENNSLLFAV